MPGMYGYNPPATVKNFDCLRRITYWAGALGLMQSLLWIGLTIVGIIAYECLINFNDYFSYGSLISYIFYDMYFRGNCYPDGYERYNSTMLHEIVKPNIVLRTEDVFIWDCVYLAVAICWLLSSVLLLTHIKKDNTKLTIGIVQSWVFITLAICIMDLALGIIFGIDYSRFSGYAYDFNLSTARAGDIDPQAAQLVAAMVVSISMMIISFKGFTLWIINVGLMLCLFKKAMCIAQDKDGNDTLFMPRKVSDDNIITSRLAINAYDEQKPPMNAYNNDAFVPDNRSTTTIELNQEPIARAARMSTNPSLQDRRIRNVDAYQQYPPPRYNRNESVRQEPISPTPITPVAAFPAPDYSPPMSRSNLSQSQNGLLRNQRY